jgi:maltooligosyltrehalose trehalohydrolase
MSRAWTLERGAQVLPNGAVRFAVWAPRAERVTVRLVSGPAKGDHGMTRSRERGVFECVVEGAAPPVEYGFLLNDNQHHLVPDPISRWQPDGPHGPSRVVDPCAHRWSDSDWRGIEMADLILYELHVGTFTREGTFAAASRCLPELASLGVTAVEIMPVAQFPGERNWGYDGVSLYAVQNSYGGPEALKQFVECAHSSGLAVILDVVYNHVGPEGNYLREFGPYFTEKYKTPWGPALNYDDADSDDVRRFVVDNARYWIEEYHCDGLRLDAVHGIFDFSAKHLLQEITEAVQESGARQGRNVVVIGESDLNDPKLVRRVPEHGYGLDGQWSDDFHHAVHALLTGESSGYYSDFGTVSHVAEALREPFVYAGQYSTYRRRRHGAPSTGIPRQRFVVATQNHDQVGNRAVGERLSALLDGPKLKLAAALLLLSPYVPLIFMGEEYGEKNPFLYFVSHGDDAIVEAVRKGRREEFASFGWRDDVPDPQSESTHERSRLDRSVIAKPEHAEILSLYRELIALRRDEPLLRPDAAAIRVDHSEAGWISMLREAEAHDQPHQPRATDTNAILTLFNCSANRVSIPLPASARCAWTLRFSTDAADDGGAGDTVTLAPWSAALYERVAH